MKITLVLSKPKKLTHFFYGIFFKKVHLLLLAIIFKTNQMQ